MASRTRPRIALLGLAHETNTFVDTRVTLAVLEEAPLLRGDQIVQAHRGGQSSVSGFLAVDGERADVVPLIFAFVTPMGLVTSGALEAFLTEARILLAAGAPWDGVFLVLHGAGVSEAARDMDGHIITVIRDEVGEKIPVGVALDMHANLSRRMIDGATVTTLYRTNPHLDAAIQASRCADLILRTIDGEIDPRTSLVQLPLVPSILTHETSTQPLCTLLPELERVERADGALYAGLALGYPYADVPELGMAVVVIDNGDQQRARLRCYALAGHFWNARARFVTTALPPDEAVASALTAEERPVVILDVGDNVGAGAYGDSTILNHALYHARATNILSVLTDPAAVDAATSTSVGDSVRLRLGGRSSSEIGPPINLDGRLRIRSDGRFLLGKDAHGGLPDVAVGTTIVVDSDKYGTVIVTSRPFMPFGLQPYLRLGLDPSGFDIIVAKGVVAPKAGFTDVAREFVVAATPGPTRADIGQLLYKHRRRPLFGFESNTTWQQEFANRP